MTWASSAVPIFPPGVAQPLDLRGALGVAPAYPGCPHCGAMSIVRCGSCDAVSCWNGETTTVSCAHCRRSSVVTGSIVSLTTQNG